jgi:hypothetical protein
VLAVQSFDPAAFSSRIERALHIFPQEHAWDVVFAELPWVAQSLACRGCPDHHVTTQVRLHSPAHTSGTYPPELLAVRAGVENVHVCFDGCKIPRVRIRALLQSVLADQVPKVPVLSYCRRSHHGKELCMPPISSPTPPIHLSQHEKHVM